MRVLFVLLVLAAASGAAFAQQAKRKIIVIDTKTISVDGKEWGIKGYDAPRLKRPRCEDERTKAIVLQNGIISILDSGTVKITPAEGRIDRWLGLATVTVDGRDLGEILIETGLATRPGALQRWGCPPPPPRKPVPKLAECKGLDEVKCARTSGCKWIKRSAPNLKDYCRRG